MSDIFWNGLAVCGGAAVIALLWALIDVGWGKIHERQDGVDVRIRDIDERIAALDRRLGVESGQRKQLGHYLGYLEADLEADLGSVKRKVESLPPSLWLEGSSPIGDGLPKLPKGLRRLPTADDTCEGR